MKALAESSGISPSYLSEVERGLKRPSTDVIAKISRAMGMRASEFLERVESTHPTVARSVGPMESPRARGRMAGAEFPIPLAALEAEAAPTRREELLRALIAVAEQMEEDDLAMLAGLAERLSRAREGPSREK